jgi:hypothetical protein
MFVFCNLAYAEPSSLSSIFIAGNIAYRDFNIHLLRQTIQNDEVLIFYSKIENYTIIISNEDEFYKILFIPRLHDVYSLRGGGGEYLINKKNFSIHKRIFYK